MVGKGNLTVFESSNISETRMATPIKIGVHAHYIDLYLHDSQMLSVIPLPLSFTHSDPPLAEYHNTCTLHIHVLTFYTCNNYD